MYNRLLPKEPKRIIEWKCPICGRGVKYKGSFCNICWNHNKDLIAKHRIELKEKRKFVSGDKIATLDDLLEQEWVIWYDATRHIEVIKSLQLRMILMLLERGALCKAIRKKEAFYE